MACHTQTETGDLALSFTVMSTAYQYRVTGASFFKSLAASVVGYGNQRAAEHHCDFAHVPLVTRLLYQPVQPPYSKERLHSTKNTLQHCLAAKQHVELRMWPRAYCLCSCKCNVFCTLLPTCSPSLQVYSHYNRTRLCTAAMCQVVTGGAAGCLDDSQLSVQWETKRSSVITQLGLQDRDIKVFVLQHCIIPETSKHTAWVNINY